jgi:hypothetical protein
VSQYLRVGHLFAYSLSHNSRRSAVSSVFFFVVVATALLLTRLSESSRSLVVLRRQRLLSNYLVHVLRRPNLRGLRIVSEFLTLPEWSGTGVVQAATGNPARDLIKSRRLASTKSARRASKSPMSSGGGGTASDFDDDEDDDEVYAQSLRELADLRMPAAVREAVERERGIGRDPSAVPSAAGPAYVNSVPGGAGPLVGSAVGSGGGGGGSAAGVLPTRASSTASRTAMPTKTSSMSLTAGNGGAAGAAASGPELQELDRSRLLLSAEFEWRDIGRKCSGTHRDNFGRTEKVTVFVMAPGLVVSTRHWWVERAHVVARMKSDNVLRLIGAVTTEDPHLYVVPAHPPTPPHVNVMPRCSRGEPRRFSLLVYFSSLCVCLLVVRFLPPNRLSATAAEHAFFFSSHNAHNHTTSRHFKPRSCRHC